MASKLSERIGHAYLCHSITEDSDICTCYVGEIVQLEEENERLLQLEIEIKKVLTPDTNFKGTLPSWKPIKALLR